MNIFKNFLMDVLLNFNSFETLNGFYRQRQGLSMGGKLSPALSNILLNMLELEIIKKYLDKKIVLFYCRYVDDGFLLVRKRYKNIILSEMNNFDPFLKFTSDEMVNNSIKYLDTIVILNDDKLELQQFHKPENVVLNYKRAISPLQYKNSCISGEIFRAKHCTSNDTNLELALTKLKQTFINNSYPLRVINKTITEIKNRNFGPNPNKQVREADRNNPDLKFYSLTLAYTSHMCSKIAANLKNITKKYTPNYRLNVIFKTITLENIILPRLKPTKPLKLTPNSVYLFTCDCITETYVGQTSKILKSRVFQHGNRNNSHINKHITECTQYKEALENTYGTDPNDTQCRNFLFNHFKCLKSNLTNWYERTSYEGMCITQLLPTLNKQQKFRQQNMLCVCITKLTDFAAFE